GAAGGARQEKPPEGAGRPNRPPPRWRGGTRRPPWDAGVTTATALTPSRSTCVACVPFGGGGTRHSRNASCRRSASRVVAGPILRLTNQRSPRRTSSARRLIAAPLHSVGYRQQAHCHDCCPRSSSYVTAAQAIAAAPSGKRNGQYPRLAACAADVIPMAIRKGLVTPSSTGATPQTQLPESDKR